VAERAEVKKFHTARTQMHARPARGGHTHTHTHTQPYREWMMRCFWNKVWAGRGAERGVSWSVGERGGEAGGPMTRPKWKCECEKP